MKKKRIVHLIGSFNSGGSERQALQMFSGFSSADEHELFLATLDKDGPLIDQLQKSLIDEAPEFPLSSFYDLNFLRQVHRFANFLRERDVDIVHTHDFYTNVFGILSAKLSGVRGKIASKRETTGMRSPNQVRVERLAFRVADRILVNSLGVRKHVKENYGFEEKTAMIYSGIDADRFVFKHFDRCAALSRFGLPTDPSIRYITMVANLRHKVKNHPMLFRAAKQITSLNANAQFVVAGEGELREGLERLADELGIRSRLHFVGRCENVPELLAASHIGVLTSTAEGFSNSILEYMAAGLPVVATDVGGARECVEDGASGFLVPSDDDTALANRIALLLANPSTSREIGLRGKAIVRERFSVSAQLSALERLYTDVLTPR